MTPWAPRTLPSSVSSMRTRPWCAPKRSPRRLASRSTRGGTGWRAPDAAETHALVAGLTCGRPSNPGTGEDECHAEASYAIIDKNIKENRNHGTGISGNDAASLALLATTPSAPTTPVTSSRAPSGTAAATTTATRRPATSPVPSQRFRLLARMRRSPAARAATIRPPANTRATSRSARPDPDRYHERYGRQRHHPARASACASGLAGAPSSQLKVTDSTTKAYDGQCLKCHRDGTGLGVGLTK